MTRLVIHKSMRFAALQRSTTLTSGNLSAHLAVLENANYIVQERRERLTNPAKTIRITPTGEAAFRAYVERLKELVRGLEVQNSSVKA